MFTRSTSFVLAASKAELKKSGVRYTAQSKKNRIEVQLLKDFPGIGVKGQIVAVKPSAMTSKLYPHNGAIYMNYKGAEPAIPVVTKAAAAAAAATLKAAQQQENKSKKEKKVKLNPILKSEIENSKKTDDLLTLDDLLSIDLNIISKENEDLIFAKLPKKLIILKNAKNSVLNTPIESDFVANQIKITLSKYIKESDLTMKFFSSEKTSITIKNEAGETIESIENLGSFYAEVKYNDREHMTSVIVNAK